MNIWFADTFYFLALRNRKDEAHSRALAITNDVSAYRLVTTAWILTEVGDALASRANRSGFGELLQMLRDDSQTEIIPADQALFDRGIDLYLHRLDKEWSLTDCISFAVMEERGIRDALTADHHFEQAGFRALLKSTAGT